VREALISIGATNATDRAAVQTVQSLFFPMSRDAWSPREAAEHNAHATILFLEALGTRKEARRGLHVLLGAAGSHGLPGMVICGNKFMSPLIPPQHNANHTGTDAEDTPSSPRKRRHKTEARKVKDKEQRKAKQQQKQQQEQQQQQMKNQQQQQQPPPQQQQQPPPQQQQQPQHMPQQHMPQHMPQQQQPKQHHPPLTPPPHGLTVPSLHGEPPPQPLVPPMTQRLPREIMWHGDNLWEEDAFRLQRFTSHANQLARSGSPTNTASTSPIWWVTPRAMEQSTRGSFNRLTGTPRQPWRS